jgi:hypothetical protein
MHFVNEPYLEPFYEKLLTGGLSAISWQEGALVLLFELVYRSWLIFTVVKGWQALKNPERIAVFKELWPFDDDAPWSDR